MMPGPDIRTIEVVVWDDQMFPRAAHDTEGTGLGLYSWESKLQAGYYRIHVAPQSFENSQPVRDLVWNDYVPDSETISAESGLGEWELPRAWLVFGQPLWIRIERIDEPITTDEIPDHLARGYHHCPWSPDRRCRYDADTDPACDFCVYCGMPDERK